LTGLKSKKILTTSFEIEEEQAMNHRVVLGVVIIFALILSTVPVMAHHSFAGEFDVTKPITKRGSVTKIEWTNPHVWFYINVKNDNGNVETWGFEMGGPRALGLSGWTRDSMKIGDEVIVEGTLARAVANKGNARTVTLAKTGQKLGAASSEGQQP
jgi:uncharacterized protein DUF6152